MSSGVRCEFAHALSAQAGGAAWAVLSCAHYWRLESVECGKQGALHALIFVYLVMTLLVPCIRLLTGISLVTYEQPSRLVSQCSWSLLQTRGR